MNKKKIRNEISRTISIWVIVLLLITSVSLASGNPIPGRWEKVASTRVGANIIIYTKDGNEQKCCFGGFEKPYLTCTNKNNQELQIDLHLINEIILPKRGKHIKRGALYGLLGGAALGVASATYYNGNDVILHVPYLAIAGTITGFFIGSLTGSPETIYISKKRALEKSEAK